MGLGYAVEHGIRVGHVGTDDPLGICCAAFCNLRHSTRREPFRRGFAWIAGLRAIAGYKGDDPAADFVEVRQDRIDVLARDAVGVVAKRRQRIFDRVRPLCDRRLSHDAGGALERVGEAKQALHRPRAAAVLLDVEDALRELVEQVARLGAEIAVRILRHAMSLAANSGLRPLPPYAA